MAPSTIVTLSLACSVAALGASSAGGAGLSWPPARAECRPWTRWWWLGSAVHPEGLTRHLELLQRAGFGGVEVNPIYGAEGAESRYVAYLSPRWRDLLAHASREAKRLGLGIDLIQGTGWPFGGPWVKGEDAAMRLEAVPVPRSAGGGAAAELPTGPGLLALIAVSPEGEALDVTGRLEAGGRLAWEPPAGWSLHAVRARPTGQQVKRAAPGGEGPVLDPFSPEALRRYLSAFNAPFASHPSDAPLRSLFNDSFEVFGANWTPRLFERFERLRGYDLRPRLTDLFGWGDPETVLRVRSDYRQTVADLLLDGFARTWTRWAHRRGLRTRYQAHGSPANLLDLYAASDTPETEMFGPPSAEAGDAAAPEAPAPPSGWRDVFVCKLASSAAHVAGRPLCSSESMTWLAEHFRVSLARMKAQLDTLFAAGVNHVFYHGTPYSPADAEWPGWLFYASTHVGPTNTWWRDLPALNAYITRCQSFLQSGRPDNDLLVYLPIHDLWASDAGSRDLLQYLTVHNAESWLEGSLEGFAASARRLWKRGYGFDLVSDGLLRGTRARGGRIVTRGGPYRALVLAGCALIPPETMDRILALAREGAQVLVVGGLPRDVPGLGRLETRRRRLREALAELGPPRRLSESVVERGCGKGRLLLGDDLEALLDQAGVARESLVDSGLECVRRADAQGWTYFLANRGGRAVDGWVPLAVPAGSAAIFDPMTGRAGLGALRRGLSGQTEAYLQLAPGQSVVLRALRSRRQDASPWVYTAPAGEPRPLEGEWRVGFLEGGPTLPPPRSTAAIGSWTEWEPDSGDLRAFSGTARYRLAFQADPGEAEAWALDLGDVRHSARVKLNGRSLGTLVAPPYRLEVTGALKAGRNELEVEVTNLMANRIADLDRREARWRRFYFVNRDYRPFDASAWPPDPSGLLGPVRLLPQRPLRPGAG